MKKTIRMCAVAFALVMLASCDDSIVVTQAFLTDLGSENCRLASDMSLDVFKGPLDTLTYEFYLSYVEQHQAISAKGLADGIRKSSDHYLRGHGSMFLLGLLFDKERKLVMDKSRTTRIDSLVTWNEGDPAPRLEDVVAKMQ